MSTISKTSREPPIQAIKVYRPSYDDTFIYIVCEDKEQLNTYKLVNLTSNTILLPRFNSKDDAIQCCFAIKDWTCEIIEINL